MAKGKNRSLYAPIFEFKDCSQELLTYTGSINSRPATYKIGEKVKIVYNNRNPNQVKVTSF
ncbi:MAG: hypothetical protein ACJART_001941 [Maribacter sp.]|jgi:hypothetical protein